MTLLAPHPLADLFPLITGDAFHDLVADIKANGLRQPIVLYEGKILDGRNRYAAYLAGADSFEQSHFVNYTGDDPRGFVISMNVHRRHLDQQQKRDLIEKLLRETPEHSDNRIADAVGVSDKTVTAVREKLESTSEIPKLDRTIGKDGKSRPAKQKKKKRELPEPKPKPTPAEPAKVAKPAPDPAPPKVEPSAIVPPGADDLDIPPVLRRAKPTLPSTEPAKPAPVDDPEASAERRKAEYAAMEAAGEPEADGDLIATFEDAIRKLLPLATQPVERFAAANVQPEDLEKIEYFLSYVGIEIIAQRKGNGSAAA
jgi:hypothetical protein